MSPAHFHRRFRLVVTTAVFAVAECACGAPLQSVDLPLPARALPPLTVSAPVPAAPRPMFVPLAKPSDLPSRSVKRRTSLSHSAKARSGAGSIPDRAADFDSRGKFAMQAGQTAEAVAAFEHVLELDPRFADAWGKLAYLYLKQGNSAKAIDAFKTAKQLGDANGGMVTRNASGALLFP
jgi:cytochrome c-type biogenesis protein CcmH/NrfG